MIKIDLHIHTSPVVYEDKFDFSLENLKSYVYESGLQIISITNHNHFNKKQFIEIKNSLSDIVVLPGVEIDIDNSHLLLIGDVGQFEELYQRCEILKTNFADEKDYITFEKFVEIFPDYEKYILIPHYKKSPAMQQTTIKKFGKRIFCGEVRSHKQFEVLKKQKDKLIPVLFSDVRISSDLEKIPVRHTYLDINSCEFSVLKNALSDKNKVFINELKKDDEFEFLPDGSLASSKLNVIIGNRSSGKTYTLDTIYASKDENNIKYVEQFSLTGKSEKEKFNSLIVKEQSVLVDNYLSPLKELTNNIIEIEEVYDKDVDEYLSSLKEYAENQFLQDAYSKSKLFSEALFNPIDNLDTKEVIHAVIKLLQTEHNKDLINQQISIVSLTKLLETLLNRRKDEFSDYKLKIEVDKIIKDVKEKLSEKSALKSIHDVDLYSIEKNRIKINEFENLCKIIKQPKLIDTINVYRFKIELRKLNFLNASSLKKSLKTSKAMSDTFEKYDKPFKFIKAMQNLGFSIDEISKSIVNFSLKVLNERGVELSGGERAEYNLLHELKEADKYDILLLDEPEASFDNPFIKDYIIDIIKSVSNKTTVFLSTHNNTLGMLLRPNKFIYTQSYDNDTYKVYTSEFGEKYLKNINEETVVSYDKILDVMEAGEEAYNERKMIYESFKNR